MKINLLFSDFSIALGKDLWYNATYEMGITFSVLRAGVVAIGLLVWQGRNASPFTKQPLGESSTGNPRGELVGSGVYWCDSDKCYGPIEWIEVGNYRDSRRFDILGADLSSDTIRLNHSNINFSSRSSLVSWKSLCEEGASYLKKVHVKARSISMDFTLWTAAWSVLVWAVGTVTGKKFRTVIGVGEII